MRRDGDSALASWRPVLQGPDIVALNVLVTTMPPVCRTALGQPDGHELVVSALTAMVDVQARATMPADIDVLPRRRGRAPKRIPAAEAWMTALLAPDGRFDADPDALDTLAEALRPWDEFGIGTTAPARATFRLAEPDPDDEESGWRLEFLLQSTADPSLLVAADQVWNDDGGLSRWLLRPQELLLAELGRASRVYPGLIDGLRSACPNSLDLDVDSVYAFLSTSHRCSTKPVSGYCCRRGGTGAASSASPCPPAPRSTGSSPRSRNSARHNSSTSDGNWPSARTP